MNPDDERMTRADWFGLGLALAIVLFAAAVLVGKLS